MCKVKSGIQIQNRQDVQNLVIGIIFRQCIPYKMDELLDTISFYMKDSQYNISEEDLYYMVSDSLDMLCIRNRIKCQDGVYTSQPYKAICI